jgi:hypothetical protein
VNDEQNETRQLKDAAQQLLGAELKLVAAMQNFVDAQASAGRSKGRALDILRQLLRKRREEKAKRHRAAFKIVG